MFDSLTVSARYALINNMIIRLDEIQTVYPATTDNNRPGQSSNVYFRNGQITTIDLTREEILKILVSKE